MEIVVVLFPFLVQRFQEMEYLMLGLATGAPCIAFPLFFDDTVGFFLPKTLDHFFCWSFFCTLFEMCSFSADMYAIHGSDSSSSIFMFRFQPH